MKKNERKINRFLGKDCVLVKEKKKWDPCPKDEKEILLEGSVKMVE